ncbi:MAG: hypothetical protein K2H01_10775, partial [Ruminococcus sp.]|nr:hypothetical protein [Ruminococcus sp.]
MKMKKTLAFIAALSMFSVTGVNAFAQEAAVTETVTEAETVATEVTEEEATEDVEIETETEITEEEAAIDGAIEEDVITNAIDADKEEVTEEMLLNKFLSETGYDKDSIMSETFTNINGVPSTLITVKNGGFETYLINISQIKLINSGSMGGQSYKTFTCDGYEFLVELVKRPGVIYHESY